MPSASSKLEILIEAKNNASAPIKQVEGSLKGLDSAASGISGGLTGLAGAAGIAGIGALGVAAAASVVDMAKTAAETERLGTAFDTLASQAGQSGDAMLAAMQSASQGTISNADLMASANRAMLLGVSSSATEMAQLMDVAAARGKAMGESTSQAFSDLVTGIGRMSPMILDNLGITLDAKKVNDAYAESIGTTAEKLTEAQKKQALLNAVVQSSTDLVKANKDAGGDAASNYERMDAAITNAKDALGQLFSPAVAAIAASIADATQAATRKLDELQGGAGTAGLGLDELTQKMQDYRQAIEDTSARLAVIPVDSEQYRNVSANLAILRGQLNEITRAHDNMIPSIELANQDFRATSMTADQARAAIAGLDQAARGATTGLDAMGNRLPWLVGQLAALTAQSDAARAAIASIQGDAIGALQSAAKQAVPVLGADKVSSMYDERKKKLGEQIEILTRYGYTTDQATFKALELEKAAAEPFVSAVEAAKEAEKANAHAAASVDQLSHAYEDLHGKVASVLSGALDTGTGVDPQKALEAMGFPREDAINENARRLADIAANGLKNQDWLGQFQQQVPDIWKMIRLAQNPQEEAARLLQDFQDGLLTSPIDKEKAKEIVKRQIMGDQNMADLANEIATELAQEMGVPLQEAMAATQKTLGGGGGMGTEAATQFADGASQALDATGGGGAAFVSKYVDQMRAQYSLLATAGTEAGKRWGDAFLAKVGDSVPPQLISLLTDLITPAVLSRLAQRGTLTGATP